jgi:hypothetical protein
MKKTFILTILITVFIVSCNKNQDENTYSISEEHEYEVKSDIIYPAEGKDSLNNFLDLVIVDSFVIVTNIFGDTLVNIYKNLDFSNCLIKILKGNGPKEFVESTVLVNRSIGYDTITFIELNARRIKKMHINENNTIDNFEAEFTNSRMPSPVEFNITEKYIFGLNIDDRRMFAYNRETNKIIKSDYYPKANREYDNSELTLLYGYRLAVNKYNETICGALPFLNCIVFFDFELNPKKTIIVGDKLYFPKPDYQHTFYQEKYYFLDVCGTTDYVYCLYKGATAQKTIPEMKIFVFNWEGELVTIIQTNSNIYRISADKNNKYLLAILPHNNWTTTDIVKIPLEGILKK